MSRGPTQDFSVYLRGPSPGARAALAALLLVAIAALHIVSLAEGSVSLGGASRLALALLNALVFGILLLPSWRNHSLGAGGQPRWEMPMNGLLVSWGVAALVSLVLAAVESADAPEAPGHAGKAASALAFVVALLNLIGLAAIAAKPCLVLGNDARVPQPADKFTWPAKSSSPPQELKRDGPKAAGEELVPQRRAEVRRLSIVSETGTESEEQSSEGSDSEE